MNGHPCKAITSEYTLNMISQDLKKKRYSYYIIFWLIVETGIPLENISKLTCADISGENVTFNPVHKDVVRKENLSPRLQDDIKELIKDKKPDDYAFTSKKDTSKPMFIRCFQKALEKTSSFYNLEPPVTATTLRKTYIYHLLTREHNLEKIFAITKCRSKKAIYEYLELEPPEQPNPDAKRMTSYDARDAIIHEKMIEKTAEHFQKVMSTMKTELEIPSKTSVCYTAEAMKVLNEINSSLSRFEVFSNPKE